MPTAASSVALPLEVDTIERFHLILTFGELLRGNGIDPRALSYAEIEQSLEMLFGDEET